MSKAMAEILGASLSNSLVIAKQLSPGYNPYLNVLIGGHPVPDKCSQAAGEKVLELVSNLGKDDLLICLISGGGSALVTSPVAGLSLEDIQELTSTLLACGASIEEINTLRRRLDKIKGGGIVKMTSGAMVISLILSDVMGNRLEGIASGPTAPDPTTRNDALQILEKYKLKNHIPDSIFRVISSSEETLKPGDPIFKRVQHVIIGSNLLSAQSALAQAELEGFNPHLFGTELQGEARVVAHQLTRLLGNSNLAVDHLHCPACIVAGGETTVTVKGKGKGGRNTELALAAVRDLTGFNRAMLITLATDGEDGSTGAAGAVATGDTLHRAAALGLDPETFLNANDSYSFFLSLDDLLMPGSTGTNVNDLVFLFQF
jgi:glycerate 2-kinase